MPAGIDDSRRRQMKNRGRSLLDPRRDRRGTAGQPDVVDMQPADVIGCSNLDGEIGLGMPQEGIGLT